MGQIFVTFSKYLNFIKIRNGPFEKIPFIFQVRFELNLPSGPTMLYFVFYTYIYLALGSFS